MSLRTLRAFVADQTPLNVPRDMTVTDVALRMKTEGKGAVMVVEGSRLIGIFTERDARCSAWSPRDAIRRRRRSAP